MSNSDGKTDLGASLRAHLSMQAGVSQLGILAYILMDIKRISPRPALNSLEIRE
jgi:hypothetical protein